MADIDRSFHTETGRLCLDCVATLGMRGPQEFDRWRDTQEFGRWLDELNLFDAEPMVDEELLVNARQLREAIYQVVQSAISGSEPDPASLKHINAWAARQSLVQQLSTDGLTVYYAGGQPVTAALATIAVDAIDLVSGKWIERIRKCAATDCSVLFVDTSRPGKRRWCSMNRCGNKQKKRRFKAKMS